MLKRLFFLLVAVLTLYAPFSEAQTFPAGDAVENSANGVINWTAGEVYAKGIGAPPARPVNPTLARAMAERAAFVVAIRNLLETVKGVQVDSRTVVENVMTKSDTIRTKVDGIVKGARILRTQHLSDGSVEMLVGIGMKGAFLNALTPDTFGKSSPIPSPERRQNPPIVPLTPSDVKPQPALPPKMSPTPNYKKKTEPLRTEPDKPAPPAVAPQTKTEPVRPRLSPAPRSDTTVVFNGGVATGLVIDGRGLGLRPALLPRIIDEQGQEVYVGQVVTRTNAVEQGVAGYAKDVKAASNNFRVTDNPAVIKGLRAAGATKTDIVIGQKDAQNLRQLSSRGDFLQYCRVIIVY
jgi:hypothetical protein